MKGVNVFHVLSEILPSHSLQHLRAVAKAGFLCNMRFSRFDINDQPYIILLICTNWTSIFTMRGIRFRENPLDWTDCTDNELLGWGFDIRAKINVATPLE